MRILGEGQYDLEGDALQALKRADENLFAAVVANEEDAFHQALDMVLDLVRTKGAAVPLQRLTESDLVLPHADTTLAEARKMFSDHPL